MSLSTAPTDENDHHSIIANSSSNSIRSGANSSSSGGGNNNRSGGNSSSSGGGCNSNSGDSSDDILLIADSVNDEPAAATELRESLECPVCLCLFRKPKQLSCGHTFCHECLTRIIAVATRADDDGYGDYGERAILAATTVSCPTCRVRTQWPSGGLPNNFVIRELASKFEDRSPAGYCRCGVCYKSVRKSQAAVCRGCAPQLPLCCVCALRVHGGHDIEILARHAARKIAAVAAATTTVDDNENLSQAMTSGELAQCLERIEAEKNALEGMARDLSAAITKNKERRRARCAAYEVAERERARRLVQEENVRRQRQYYLTSSQAPYPTTTAQSGVCTASGVAATGDAAFFTANPHCHSGAVFAPQPSRSLVYHSNSSGAIASSAPYTTQPVYRRAALHPQHSQISQLMPWYKQPSTAAASNLPLQYMQIQPSLGSSFESFAANAANVQEGAPQWNWQTNNNNLTTNEISRMQQQQLQMLQQQQQRQQLQHHQLHHENHQTQQHQQYQPQHHQNHQTQQHQQYQPQNQQQPVRHMQQQSHQQYEQYFQQQPQPQQQQQQQIYQPQQHNPQPRHIAAATAAGETAAATAAGSSSSSFFALPPSLNIDAIPQPSTARFAPARNLPLFANDDRPIDFPQLPTPPVPF